MHSLKNWFPLPPDQDEDLRFTAQLLYGILVTMTGITLLITFPLAIFLLGNDTRIILQGTGALVLSVLMYALVRFGKIRLACWLLLGLFWILNTNAVWTSGGVASPSFTNFVLLIVTAGLLLGAQAGVLFTLLSALLGLAIVFVEARSGLPGGIVQQTPLSLWVSHVAIFSMVAFLQGFASRTARDALRRARNSETLARKELEERVRTEEKYRAMVEHAVYGIFQSSPAGKFLRVNSAMARIYGYDSPEEMIHVVQNIGEQIYVDPADRDRFTDEVSSGSLYGFEARNFKKDGSVIWVSSNARIVKDTSGAPLYYEGTVEDITQRKQFDEALRASEEKFSKSFQSSPDAITISSVENGKFLEVNDGFCIMSGFTREESIGRSAEQLGIWADIQQRKKMVSQLERDGQVRDFEATLHRKSGETVNCLLSVEAVEIGGEHFMIVITRDVTERRKMEQELRLNEERYRMISSVISDYIFSTTVEDDTSLRQVWVAGAFEKISGYTLDELHALGGWRATVHPDDLSLDDQAMDILHQNNPVTSELRVIHKDGTIRWVRTYGHPVWDYERNCLSGIYGAVQDINEQKRAEQERENLIKELEAKNAELEQFTYTVSHDLKAPIITIKGFLGYLRDDAKAGNIARLEKDLHRIGEATDKMHKLLNDLLELSRIGRVTNAFEQISMDDVIKNVVDTLHGRLGASNVDLVVHSPLPVVYADRQRVIEILQNLLDNAAKFMGDQPQPRIEVLQAWNVRDGFATICVRDNGMGIAPEYHERIFGLFNRLNPNLEGTGVGLALVKRIVEFHGGKIWVESKLGEGAAFYFTIPLPA